MKTLHLFKLAFVFSFLSIFSSFAQLQSSLLWEISGNGIEKPSYLYGTIHMACEVNFPQKLINAMEGTEQLYLEIKLDDPNLQRDMMKGMQMKDGKKISSLVSKEEFEKLNAFFKSEIGMPLSMLEQTKPALLQSMLISLILECKTESAEMKLLQMYNERKQAVYGLETVQDQLDVFDKIAYEDQVKALVKMANSDLVHERKLLNNMMKFYELEDIESLLTSMDEDMYSPDQNVFLLDNRNKKWVKPMANAMAAKSTLFAVGAAHLAGENGVIKLLRKAGYTVEPILE